MDTVGHPVFEYCPSVDGGHARYVDHLISALARVDRRPLTWVAGTELPGRFDRDDRRVWRTIPTIRPRATFRGDAAWIADRITYQFRRESALLRAVLRSPAGSIFHLHEWNWLLGAGLNLAARASGRHVVITVHNLQPHRFPPGIPRRLVTALERLVWRTASGLIVHADAQRDRLREMLGAHCPPIAVAPHGTWSDQQAGPGDPRPQATPGAADAPLRLLCYGTIRRNKGFELAVAALARLRRPATLTIAGGEADPSYAQALRRSVAEARAAGADVVLDARFVPDREVPALFARHDLLLLPYGAFEAQSGVLFDAIALGLPVVASTAGALGETVRAWGIGRVVASRDPARWAEALETIDERTLLRFRAALRRAAAEHGWDAAGRRTAELFERLGTS